MYLGPKVPYCCHQSGRGIARRDQVDSTTNPQEDKMWLGMNLEVVKGELPKWQNLVEELDGIINNVNTQVQAANEAWNGADSEKFVSEWEGQHRPQLEKVKGLITQLVDTLQADISQQAETSAG